MIDNFHYRFVLPTNNDPHILDPKFHFNAIRSDARLRPYPFSLTISFCIKLSSLSESSLSSSLPPLPVLHGGSAWVQDVAVSVAPMTQHGHGGRVQVWQIRHP